MTESGRNPKRNPIEIQKSYWKVNLKKKLCREKIWKCIGIVAYLFISSDPLVIVKVIEWRFIINSHKNRSSYVNTLKITLIFISKKFTNLKLDDMYTQNAIDVHILRSSFMKRRSKWWLLQTFPNIHKSESVLSQIKRAL